MPNLMLVSTLALLATVAAAGSAAALHVGLEPCQGHNMVVITPGVPPQAHVRFGATASVGSHVVSPCVDLSV